MNKIEIPKIASECLSGSLDMPGSVLYSSHETLKEGDVYLLGFNPGGTGGNPVRKSIESMLSNTKNAYIDESWENNNGVWTDGKAPLQKRVCWVLESIGQTPKNVCASNLIFFQSQKARQISYSLANKCWPVHEAILEIIKPKIIIAFGNSAISPYSFLSHNICGQEEKIPSGHGSWSVKGFNGQINGRPVYIAGLPHLSRYSPIGKKQVIEWLLQKI